MALSCYFRGCAAVDTTVENTPATTTCPIAAAGCDEDSVQDEPRKLWLRGQRAAQL
jgi:hypothetical protein